MSYFSNVLWAGTEGSLQLAEQMHEQVMAALFTGKMAEPEPDAAPYNFGIQGNVGVVSIKGPLVNSDSWMNSLVGQTSYADIRRSMVYAATNPDVQSILLDIDSPGGEVSGIQDASDLISQIDSKVKPVYAFTGGQMNSAAYWLGSTARKVYVSPTSTSGSIGVIQVHQEYSKQAEQQGVGITVQRAGKYKALLNPLEKATTEALDQNQERLDAAYGVFLAHAATQRGMTAPVADATIGQGRVFFGAQAVAAGLADSVGSFDSVMSKISKKVVDANVKQPQTVLNGNGGIGMTTRQALTEQDIAALAAGGGTVQAGEIEAPPVEQTEQVASTEAATVEDKPVMAESAGVIAYLHGEMAKSNETLMNLKIELAAANASLASMKATYDSLKEIAGDSVKNMRVALNQAKIDTKTISAEALVAEHAAALANFTKNFKAGGVSAAKPAERQDDMKLVGLADPMQKARLASTRLN